MVNTKELKEHIYDVVGALHEVHKELGVGLNEFCYQEGLEMELSENAIPFRREVSFHPVYHGKQMRAFYRIDFLCKEDIIVECKAVEKLTDTHRAQLFNYLRLLHVSCGILVNFAPKYMEIERYFYDKDSQNIITTDGSIKRGGY